MKKKAVYFAPVLAAAVALALPATGTAAQSAQHPQHHHYGLGLDLAKARAESARLKAQPRQFALRADIPASADLAKYQPAPGDQGQVNSCVAWATGYTSYSILMNEQGITDGPMAPMFVYSQIVNGQNVGTYPEDNLNIEQQQGIDTKADYTQGDFDYTSQPTDAERTNAAKYKLSGYDSIAPGDDDAIRSAISAGEPVIMSFAVRQSFEDIDSGAAADYSYAAGDDSSDPVLGGHEVTIVGYDEKGVRIENSWGASWGDQGFINVSWDYLNSADVQDFHALHKLA